MRKKFNQYSKEADTIFPRNLIIKYGIIGLRPLPLEKELTAGTVRSGVICNCFIDKIGLYAIVS